MVYSQDGVGYSVSMSDFNPDSLFENFGHIGAGKKMKRPVIQEAEDHKYQTEVELYVSGGKQWETVQTKVTMTWTLKVSSSAHGVQEIVPLIPDQIFSIEVEDENGVTGVEQVKISEPEIEIMTGESSVPSLALIPYEIEIYPNQKPTVRFFGGGS